MKPIIVSLPLAAVAVSAGAFLKKDGAGAVTTNDTAGSEIGIAASKADNSASPDYKFKNANIGCIKQGIVVVTAVAATYNAGDIVEVATGGQTVQAHGSGSVIGSVVETKTLAAPGDLKVYVNIA
jgi:hypothetical protein